MFKKIENIIIIILLAIIVFMGFKTCNTEKELIANNVILTDSLYEYRNKVGELYAEKATYISTIDDLSRINQELYDECKKLKDNPIVVTKIETVTKIDSIYIKSEPIIVNDKITNNYNYNDNYLNMNISHVLYNNIGELFVNDISVEADIYYDIIENKKSKSLSIITRSTNPYLKINDVNGGIINPTNSKTLENYFKHRNKWSFGISGGMYCIYDVNSKTIGVGPGFGLSLSYNFYLF